MTMPGGRDEAEGNRISADDRAAATENAAADALTCIRPAYTLAGHDSNANASEIDDLMVKNLLAALAEVALSVAARMTVA